MGYLPGLVQIRPQYTEETDAPDHVENVTWWRTLDDSALSGPQIQAVQTKFDPLWGAMWASIGGAAQSYQGSVATGWQSDTDPSFDSRGTATPVSGTKGVTNPPNVAALVSGNIALRYRGGRPRWYLPYVGSDINDPPFNDQMSSGAVEAWNEELQTLIGGMAIASAGAPACGPVSFRRATTLAFPWTYYNGDIMYASQRRRLRRPSRRR